MWLDTLLRLKPGCQLAAFSPGTRGPLLSSFLSLAEFSSMQVQHWHPHFLAVYPPGLLSVAGGPCMFLSHDPLCLSNTESPSQAPNLSCFRSPHLALQLPSRESSVFKGPVWLGWAQPDNLLLGLPSVDWLVILLKPVTILLTYKLT